MFREEIETFLPHRPPMLLVDELSLDQNGDAVGAYLVKGEEEFLKGHFPGFPVLPGVLMCEIIAQTAGILVKDELQKNQLPLFTGIEQVRFRRMVRPGERIDTHCRVLRTMGKLIKVAGEARVGEELCCDGVFLMMLKPREA